MAGYTERVDTMITVLEDCAQSRYKRKIASEAVINSKIGQSRSSLPKEQDGKTQQQQKIGG